ncbi:GAF domain-containing protein [Enterovirga sp.]|jgi:GAF domain-containing protein|uniref:GAF domain-containing protein n=1 Tax=Enterovirga sp. TaxID=2026350 RepID=UPI0026200BBC|nr:GAF domain-containing protein [Enterovirga sp.]MDB5591542.1 hypothetical protein [Enterovirga sp.]
MTDATITAELLAIGEVLARDASPEAAFRAVDGAVQGLVGHRLFTILALGRGDEVQRVYSSRPDSYPVSAWKRMGPTPWGDLVLRGRQPFFGADPAAIRWAFPDHELILGLGLGSVINASAVHGGRVLGTMSVLDREGAYTPDQVQLVELVAPLLIPALLGLGA